MNTPTNLLTTRTQRALGALMTLALSVAGIGLALPHTETARAYDVPLTNVAKIVVGDDHACALMYDNTLGCWGRNDYGQLGDGSFGGHIETEPVKVKGLDGDVFNAVAGRDSTCAMLSDFSVKCWGNTNRLSSNPYFINSATPVQIGGLDGTNDVLDITAGEYHACVLLPGQPFNGVLCWGDNSFGELGNSAIPRYTDPYYVSQPRRPVELPPMDPVEISAGRYHTCALAELGHVACWGGGLNGEIGDGGNSDRYSAELVDGLLSAATDIGAGDNHTCAVLSDGRVQCWGFNGNGELGNNSVNDSNVATPAVIVLASSVAAGAHHTCALTRQYTVLCWGHNGEGQLGDGTRDRSLTPQLVPGLTDVVMIDAGGNQTCAILTDTSVKCWGDGVLTPTGVIAEHIEFDNMVENPIDLGDVFSDTPDAPALPHDYGDAPDQIPATGQNIEAYPGVNGRFPTLDGANAKGPKHTNPLRHFLGDAASIDTPVDADGAPNIDATNLIANLDGADDGWLNRRDITRFDNCQAATLRIRVRRSALTIKDAPLYLNAWLDGNRDGDWQDSRPCVTGGQGYEWMVQNHQIPSRIAPAPGGYVDINVATQPVLSNSPQDPAWVRITLSDRPAITPTNQAGALPDGRGPASGYFGYGETEDYRWDPVTDLERYGEWKINKTIAASGPIDVGSTFDYVIEVARAGGFTPNVRAAVVDVLPPQTSFVSGVAFSELSPAANPASAVYESGYGGPSGRVRWTGTLSDGGRFRLRFTVRLEACPTTPVANTANLILPGSGVIITDTHAFGVRCTPPPPPAFALSKQIVDAVGSTTFSGGAQISETVYLLTLAQSNATAIMAAGIQDALPVGLTAVEVSASRGVVTTTNYSRTVSWQGQIGPSLAPPQVWIRTRVIGPAQCGRDLVNTARFAVRLADGSVAQGASGQVNFRPGCMPPPTETPRPTDVPTQRPTYTPVPAETYTPVPLPTDAPPNSPTNTPVPRPTNTSMPLPQLTNTPVPLPTDAPPNAPTNTPVPLEPENTMQHHIMLPIVVR